jgi:hypothetical protein
LELGQGVDFLPAVVDEGEVSVSNGLRGLRKLLELELHDLLGLGHHLVEAAELVVGDGHGWAHQRVGPALAPPLPLPLGRLPQNVQSQQMQKFVEEHLPIHVAELHLQGQFSHPAGPLLNLCRFLSREGSDELGAFFADEDGGGGAGVGGEDLEGEGGQVVELFGLVAEIGEQGQLLADFVVELHELHRGGQVEVVQAVAQQARGAAVNV